MKKYELTAEFIEKWGKKLFRIKALISFGSVEAGELGGYVEKEDNLAQDGDAWVYGNAEVYGRQYIGIDLNPEYCKAAEAEIPINLF